MGAPDDQEAVVDPQLRIRGLQSIRIADASVFPTMPAVNPMIGVLMVGEKCAELLGDQARAAVPVTGTSTGGDVR